MIQPAEPTIFSAGSALSRLSGFFYQCYLIPLFLALLMLSLCSRNRVLPVRAAIRIAGTLAVSAALYLLCAPVVGDFTQIGNVSHALLMSAVILYAAFFCPLPTPDKLVLTAAVLADINFAQSISTQILMPVMPLGISNLLQVLLLIAALAVTYAFRPSDAEERIPTAYWMSMLLVGVLSTACLYAIRILGGRILYVDPASWTTVAVILSAFFAVYLLMYFLYYVLVKEHRASSDLRAMQAKLTQDLEFYRRSEAVAQEYRGLRHELKNHIALMDGLLRDGQYDRLRLYFADYTGKITPQLSEYRCPNPVVSSIISHQAEAARAVEVTLDVIAAVPETLGIADDDLCSLLSNLLDNGVEGCLRAGKDLVRATLHTDRDCLFITVTNPVSEDILKENPELHSTKDSPSHGFGIPIMRRIAEKYDGFVSFHVDEGWFTADAMLYMEA